jgi:hypothetical protein
MSEIRVGRLDSTSKTAIMAVIEPAAGFTDFYEIRVIKV